MHLPRVPPTPRSAKSFSRASTMSPSNMRNGLGETRLTRLTGIQSLVNPVRLPESSQLHSHARAGFQESLGYKTAWTQTLKASTSGIFYSTKAPRRCESPCQVSLAKCQISRRFKFGCFSSLSIQKTVVPSKSCSVKGEPSTSRAKLSLAVHS